MLKLQVVRGPGVEYYVRDLVPGRAEETLVAGESPGRWTGRGSGALGLDGPVDPDGFRRLLGGRDPAGGRDLRAVRGSRPVSGFDLTFCAPKSVSVLHLLAPKELGTAVGSAHQAAVDDALGYLERHGHGVRRVRSGAVHHLASTGVVAAGFVHRTSRTLDPHLHSHVVTANVAQGVDGDWSSLDSRRLFLHGRATGAVYDASLRHHLTEVAGVAWGRGSSGHWEVEGVDPVLCRIFSQRTASIDEFHRGTGSSASAGRRRAAYFADRPDKVAGTTVDDLRSTWRRRIAVLGIDTGGLVATVGRSRIGPRSADAGPASAHRALDDLAATRSRVTARDVVATVADALPAGLPAGAADRVATALAEGLDRSVPRDQHNAGAQRADTWAPTEVAALLRTDPDLVGRAIGGRDVEVRRSGAGRDRSADGWRRRATPDRTRAFGHEGPTVPDRSR